MTDTIPLAPEKRLPNVTVPSVAPLFSLPPAFSLTNLLRRRTMLHRQGREKLIGHPTGESRGVRSGSPADGRHVR